MVQNAEKRKFFRFFSKKNAETIFFTEKSCTFASHLSLGLWCNGNTADSGPAFPGSSPGSPTERFPSGNLFFYALNLGNTPPRQFVNCCGGVCCVDGVASEALLCYDSYKFLFRHISGLYSVPSFHWNEKQGGNACYVE